MFLSKRKTTAVAIAFVALVTGAWLFVRRLLPAPRPADERREEPRKDGERRADRSYARARVKAATATPDAQGA
jgi:hypothetical protein